LQACSSVYTYIKGAAAATRPARHERRGWRPADALL